MCRSCAAVGRFPGRSVVPKCCVLSSQSSDAYPSFLSSTLARRLLFSVSVQSVSCPALQGTLVAAASPGGCHAVSEIILCLSLIHI